MQTTRSSRSPERRRLRVLLAAALAGLAIAAGAARSASAEPVPVPDPGNGPFKEIAPAFASLSLSVVEAGAGDDVDVIGSGFKSHEPVRVLLDGGLLEMTAADGGGAFTESIHIPDGLGDGTFTIGAAGLAGSSASAQLTIVSPPVPVPPEPVPPTSIPPAESAPAPAAPAAEPVFEVAPQAETAPPTTAPTPGSEAARDRADTDWQLPLGVGLITAALAGLFMLRRRRRDADVTRDATVAQPMPPTPPPPGAAETKPLTQSAPEMQAEQTLAMAGALPTVTWEDTFVFPEVDDAAYAEAGVTSELSDRVLR